MKIVQVSASLDHRGWQENIHEMVVKRTDKLFVVVGGRKILGKKHISHKELLLPQHTLRTDLVDKFQCFVYCLPEDEQQAKVLVKGVVRKMAEDVVERVEKFKHWL